MTDNYGEHLGAIIRDDLKASTSRKEVLYLLLAHWLGDKDGLSMQDIHQNTKTTISVVHTHLSPLLKDQLVKRTKRNGVLHFTINPEGLEEISRKQRDKKLLKSKVSDMRYGKNVTLEK